MKHILILTALLLLPLAALPAAESKSARPNIILILADDLGWADLGVTGSTFYETPRIDALAKQGALFRSAYTASPVCSPTRGSILTGKYPSRITLTNHSGSPGSKGPGYKLSPPQTVGNMPVDDVTLAEVLHEGGYTTAHIGKWHLASHSDTERRTYPEDNGFDLNIAGSKAGQPGTYYFPYKDKSLPGNDVQGLEDGKAGDYLTDAITDKAVAFIEQNVGKPFFLNFWHFAPHTPIQARQDKVEKYRKKATALGLNPTNNAAKPEHQSLSREQQDNPNYAAMVESLDESVGRILDTLKRLNLEQNTIVIFFSDNGGLSTGPGPNAPTSVRPLRGGKGWVYEGGIRVPLIIRYPGRVKDGRTVEVPVISTDLYPTLLDLAGLPLRPQQHVDGVSLKPLLTGEKEALDREAIFFHYPHYHSINSMGPSGAVRAGDYKLVETFEAGKIELYNLREDIGETKDLSAAIPKLTAKLTGLLHDWRRSSGAAMPTTNPDYRVGAEKQSGKESRVKKVVAPDIDNPDFYTPPQDLEGLKKNTALKPGLPNVLIIGDSISIGYTPELIRLLKDVANVQRPGNTGDTAAGLQGLSRWLDKTKWDVIHFNWGLHDLCYRHPDSKVQGHRDKVNGTQAVPLAQYEKNLEALVQQLETTGAKLIWASTTVVPEGEAGRFVGDDVKYNEAARRIMEKHGIPIDDLHALSVSFDSKFSVAKGDVHYKKEGYATLAEQVAASIRKHGLPTTTESKK